MTRIWNRNRRLALPASLSAAVALAMALGTAGYGVAQAGGRAVRNSPLIPAGTVEVAHGKVLTSAGRPVSGARIILEAWPPQSVIAHVKRGHRVPMRTAGTAVTNSAGRFTLRISAADSTRIRAEANRNGVLNLALRATKGSHAWDWFGFTRLTRARTRAVRSLIMACL